jgi:endo-1,4-beta-mannosidase
VSGWDTSRPPDLAVGEPFRVGVNYWPRRKAMGWWKAFDRGEVADELDLIAVLGMSLVRIFLLWEDFQPTPDTVSAGALADLETVCDLAAERDLGLDVTFFTGHMSGPNWAPG